MADVNISKFRASVVREGSRPATPGFVVSEGQSPTDPAGSGQNHLPVTIAPAATALAITESQILSGAGTVAQYIRGDGSLADFPEASGGGSSISYYLNGSVNQGTIGGVAYKELSKVPILGAGTDFSISADGYIASFITDAGDPNLLEIPGGNWNFETYFSSSSSGGTPTFYVELYKYDGTTFTLIASNSGSPEFIAFGTTLTAYFSTLAVPTTTLALTDRLAVRYYVTHSGRTITLHTEDNHLCQIVTTFTTGLTALNGLTAQVQNFAVGTTGTDFNIASATATHTFNLPTASATNRGALSSSDWTTFNNKQNALGFTPVPETRTITINGTTQDLSANRTYNVGTVTSVAALTLGTSGTDLSSTVANGTTTPVITLNVPTASASNRGALSAADWSTFNGKQNALTLTTTGSSGAATLVGSTLNIPNYSPDLSGYVPTSRTLTINGTTQDLSANRTFNVGTVTSVGLSSATSGVTIGSTPVTGSGTITLAIATASGSQNGLLSSTDWTTFNSKQNALTNPVTGTGTTNYLPKFTGASTIGNSNLINDASGNLGLGVTPSAWGSSAYGGTTRVLELGELGSSIGAGAGAIIIGNNWYSTNVAAIYSRTGFGATYYAQNTASGQHQWFNAPSGTAGAAVSFTQAMTLTSGGNLLVGTTTDNGARLQVSGNSYISGDLRFGTDYAGSNTAILKWQGSGASIPNSMGLFTWGDAKDIQIGGNNVYFRTEAGVNRMIITSSGNVGIGTASPTNGLLVLNSTAANGVRLALESSGTMNGIVALGSNAISGLATTDLALWARGAMAFETGASGEKMRITSSGNVGIGTASPSARLEVSSSAFNVSTFNSTFGQMAISFANNGTTFSQIGSGVSVCSTAAADDLGFGTAGLNKNIVFATGAGYLERMRITSSGNFLIGTTTDNGQRLQVNGAGGIRVNEDGSGTKVISIRSDFAGVDPAVNVATNNSLLLMTNNTERMRITSSGNVGIGTTSPAEKFVVSNGGTQNIEINPSYIQSFNRTSLVSAPLLFYASLYSFNTGNVLIGTTTDVGARLHVNGDIRTAAPSGGSAVNWKLGTARGGTITPNAIVRVEIGGVLVDLDARYV